MAVTRVNGTGSTCISAGPSFCAGAGFPGPAQVIIGHTRCPMQRSLPPQLCFPGLPLTNMQPVSASKCVKCPKNILEGGLHIQRRSLNHAHRPLMTLSGTCLSLHPEGGSHGEMRLGEMRLDNTDSADGSDVYHSESMRGTHQCFWGLLLRGCPSCSCSPVLMRLRCSRWSLYDSAGHGKPFQLFSAVLEGTLKVQLFPSKSRPGQPSLGIVQSSCYGLAEVTALLLSSLPAAAQSVTQHIAAALPLQAADLVDGVLLNKIRP